MKEIPLTNSSLMVQVDDEDYPFLSRMSWHFAATGRRNGLGYARCGKHIKMHRLVLGFPQTNKVIDHIDRNTLNNQKSNLRLVPRQYNQMNRGPQLTSTSGYKGVTHNPARSKPWRAQIGQRIPGTNKTKNYPLGSYRTREEAARAYDAKARELYGEYAYQNFPL